MEGESSDEDMPRRTKRQEQQLLISEGKFFNNFDLFYFVTIVLTMTLSFIWILMLKIFCPPETIIIEKLFSEFTARDIQIMIYNLHLPK